MYGLLISLLDKSEIIRFSCENGGERYVKHIEAWQQLVIMLLCREKGPADIYFSWSLLYVIIILASFRSKDNIA